MKTIHAKIKHVNIDKNKRNEKQNEHKRYGRPHHNVRGVPKTRKGI